MLQQRGDHARGAYLAQEKIDIRPFTKSASTALRRGYLGAWQLKDGKLYLLSVKNGLSQDAVDITAKIFPRQKKPVFAAWYSGCLRARDYPAKVTHEFFIYQGRARDDFANGIYFVAPPGEGEEFISLLDKKKFRLGKRWKKFDQRPPKSGMIFPSGKSERKAPMHLGAYIVRFTFSPEFVGKDLTDGQEILLWIDGRIWRGRCKYYNEGVVLEWRVGSYNIAQALAEHYLQVGWFIDQPAPTRGLASRLRKIFGF